MLLAEDLLLLLTDDDTGKLVVSGSEADLALGGAQLVDLTLRRRADLQDRRVAVLDESPTGDDLLDEALAVLVRRTGKKPASVIGELGKGLRDRLYERLSSAGYVRMEEGKVLGLFSTTSWPTVSGDHEATVRQAVTAALVDGATPEPQVAALVSLLHALRATHKVIDPRQHELRRKDLDKRSKEIAEGDWGSQAVRSAVDSMNAAVMASITAATVASTTATMSS